MKNITKVLALVLVVAVLVGVAAAMADGSDAGGGGAATPLAAAGLGSAVAAEKSEVVYARLSGGGEVQNIYVVNQFTLPGGGSFTDYGNYASVVNLTDLTPLTSKGGEVTASTSSEDFFYQGNLADSNLPWHYDITYTLDGAPISPENLGGCSGKLVISVTSHKNSAVDDTFYNNYMQQITVTLGIDKCRNITSSGATAANAGRNRILVYTVLPGSDAAIEITADVSDFEMAGIEITAMPFTMNIPIPDTSGMLDDFATLSEALAELNSGVGELKDGVSEIKEGTEALQNGSSGFSAGLTGLNNNSAGLREASTQVQAALSQIAEGLAAIDMSSLEELVTLAGLAGQLGFEVPDTETLMQMLQLLSGISELSEKYGEFHSGLASYTQAVGTLSSGYGDLNSGIAGLSAGMSEMYEGIELLYDGTGKLADQTSAIPGLVQDEIDNIVGGYLGGEFKPVSFTSSMNANTSFVQFVFIAQGVSKPVIEQPPQIETASLTFWDRLTKLFTG